MFARLVSRIVIAWALVSRLAAASDRNEDIYVDPGCTAQLQLVVAAPTDNDQAIIRWAGAGGFRILLEIAPVDLGKRLSDEMPAEMEIDFAAFFKKIGVEGKANAASFQIMQIDAATGEPVKYENYAHGRSEFDRPFCWYDGAIPYDFPEVFAPLSYSEGKIKRTLSPRAGYMYNAVGEWKNGRLAFVHTQKRDQSSRYAVYFDRLPLDEEPREAPPRGWLGDGLPRCDRSGDSTTGTDNTIVALDDWNNDGLMDIVYGEQYGQLFVMINRGTPESPVFPVTRMLFDADGLPIDLGIHAAVLVVDWDGDSAKDLLVGTYQNRVAFLRNVGSNQDRRFAYQGFLKTADGKPLELPVKPVAAKPEGVFTHDYYPVLTAVDWNDDGKLDLLAGGYVTGRIYYFENTSAEAQGLPALELRGPIEADGSPINVRDWCATPCVADFNGDGLLDIVSGSYTWLPDKKHQPGFLRYYENKGASRKPSLSERPFPFEGPLRQFRLPVPRPADWNNDGLLDLVVSSGADIYLFKNVGAADRPVFQMHSERLPSAWGNAQLPGRQFLDYDGDGWIDMAYGYQVFLNSKTGSPYRFEKSISILPPGVHIDHPVELGDGHFWPYLHDFDGDGKIDVLFGDWHGQVWFHRNLSGRDNVRFDVEGRRLKTQDDRPIKVGPIDGDIDRDFVALQGARTVFAPADFDNDGFNDLVVGDTYGKIRYYRNLGPPGDPQFALPQFVGDMKFRLLVDAVDWNDDGRMDVIAGTDNHVVAVFLNTGGDRDAKFGEVLPLKLPQIKETPVRVVDLNRDGDKDLFVMSTQGSILVERSFLEHGYARGRILNFERKHD